jgi:hypothetical protein
MPTLESLPLGHGFRMSSWRMCATSTSLSGRLAGGVLSDAGASILVTALSVMMLCGVTWLSWIARRRFAYVLVGWAWFVIALLPVSGLLQAGEQGVADRFLYVPILGLLVIVAWGVTSAAERITLPRAAVGATAIAVVAISTWLAREVVPSWASDLTLWTRATQVVAGNYRRTKISAMRNARPARLDERAPATSSR